MVRSPVTRWSGLACGLAAVIWLPACGGSSSNNVPPPQILVSVHPKGASVVAGSQQQQFSATVVGDPRNLGVTWAVDGLGGGNPFVGTIMPSGLYSPPPTAGVHTVTATSVSDASKNASATLGVTDLLGISTYHYDLARDGMNSQEYA